MVKLEKAGYAIHDLLDEFLKSNVKLRNEGLEEAAEFMIEKLEQAAPKETGDYSKSFSVNKKYYDKKYIHNTKMVSGKGADGRYRKEIPLSNILEYGDCPHIRKTFEENKDKVIEIVLKKIQGGNN